MALFTSGVKVNPSNVKLRNNLGMELKSAGRLEEAQHQYRVRAVCAVCAGSAGLWLEYMLHSLYRRRCRLSQSMGRCTSITGTCCLMWADTSQQQPSMLTCDLLHEWVCPEAHTHHTVPMSCSFEKALEYSGTKAKTLNNLATMYYRLGMYTQYNSTHTCHVVRALAGRWSEAEQRYKESLELSADQANTYNNLGESSASDRHTS